MEQTPLSIAALMVLTVVLAVSLWLLFQHLLQQAQKMANLEAAAQTIMDMQDVWRRRHGDPSFEGEEWTRLRAALKDCKT
jgi:hypothetical protein